MGFLSLRPSPVSILFNRRGILMAELFGLLYDGDRILYDGDVLKYYGRA